MGLLISCKKASELIAKRDMGEISRGEKFKLGLHTTLCKVCRIYKNQSQRLHKMMQASARSQKKVAPQPSKELKARIIKKIEEES